MSRRKNQYERVGTHTAEIVQGIGRGLYDIYKDLRAEIKLYRENHKKNENNQSNIDNNCDSNNQ